MRIEGERRFDVPPEDVFRALTDPKLMEDAFAAIERIDAVGDEWTVHVRVPFGGFMLKVSVHLEELREPEHARFRAWGKSLGGRVSVDSAFDLEPDAAGGTAMRWRADIDAAGLLAGLGNQRLGPVAKQQADRALERLARSVSARA